MTSWLDVQCAATPVSTFLVTDCDGVRAALATMARIRGFHTRCEAVKKLDLRSRRRPLEVCEYGLRLLSMVARRRLCESLQCRR